MHGHGHGAHSQAWQGLPRWPNHGCGLHVQHCSEAAANWQLLCKLTCISSSSTDHRSRDSKPIFALCAHAFYNHPQDN